MSEWLAILEKNDNDLYFLRFAYELNTLQAQPEQQVQPKDWEIKSIESEANYVVLELKQKNNHVNILLHHMKHSFFSLQACFKNLPYAKAFNLKEHFVNYVLSAKQILRKLTCFFIDISKYNSLVAHNNKKKMSPRKQMSLVTSGSKNVHKQICTQKSVVRSCHSKAQDVVHALNEVTGRCGEISIQMGCQNTTEGRVNW